MTLLGLCHDPVGALSVHLLNGIWGTLAVGIFASAGNSITLFGQIKGIVLIGFFAFVSSTLLGQIKGIVLIGFFAFVSSYIVLFIINKFLPLRAAQDEEMQGLDVQECGLEAYPEFKRAF